MSACAQKDLPAKNAKEREKRQKRDSYGACIIDCLNDGRKLTAAIADSAEHIRQKRDSYGACKAGPVITAEFAEGAEHIGQKLGQSCSVQMVERVKKSNCHFACLKNLC